MGTKTEHPILFTGDMVRAILDGRKTQTRRVIKPQPDSVQDGHPMRWKKCNYLAPPGHDSSDGLPTRVTKDLFDIKCPYGVPGDLLYVRESWWAVEVDKVGVQYCVFDDEFEIEALGGQYPAPDTLRLLDRQDWVYGRHPNIHLPKKQCRLWLKVKSVCVERVQEISEADAKTEGCSPENAEVNCCGGAYRNGFCGLWDSINKKRGFGWDVNPWVWVIEFERDNK